MTLKSRFLEVGSKIFFAMEGGSVRGYSDLTSDVRFVASNAENVEGLAWDSRHRQIYYTTSGKIYRRGLFGEPPNVLTTSVFQVPQCKIELLVF